MSSLLTNDEQKAAKEAPDYALAPEGIYLCRVSEVARWTSGTSLVWKFRVVKGEKLAGKEFWTWTGIKPDSIGRTKRYLTILGFDLSADPDEIVGTPCKVQVTIEARTDTGEPANKVRTIFAYDGPELPSEYGDDDLDKTFGAAEDDDELI